MGKKIVLVVLGSFLYVSSLQAMDVEEEDRPAGCAYYPILADAITAMNVINNTSEAEDNPNATIEDIRKARDKLFELARLCLNDATMYSERVTEREDATIEDYQKAITLYQMSEDNKNADCYKSIIITETSMNLILDKGKLSWNNKEFPCSWGKGGIKDDKREGDGATPVGTFPFRYGFYRADRIQKPETCLPLRAITQDDGWCDDVYDHRYNQYLPFPFGGSHEKLWREDNVYDLILVIGHNDAPVVRGKGSAIFVHLRRPEGTPTEGCVALELPDLLQVLKECTPQSALVVTGD